MQLYNYLTTIGKTVFKVSWLVFILGCQLPFLPPETVTFQLVNATNYELKLTYFIDDGVAIDSMIVEPFGVTRKRVRLDQDAPQNPTGLPVDSIVVSFDSERALIFFCPESTEGFSSECRQRYFGQKNPYLFFENGAVSRERGIIRELVYTLAYDQDDYERAVEL